MRTRRAGPVSEPFDDVTSCLSRVTVTATHTFTEPRTYFPALRATAQRNGDFRSPFGRAQNLGRVRVVVHPPPPDGPSACSGPPTRRRTPRRVERPTH